MSTTKKLYIIPLHHSQTLHSFALLKSPTLCCRSSFHHSQTVYNFNHSTCSLCTIHFYIILKLISLSVYSSLCLCTIHSLHHSQTDSLIHTYHTRLVLPYITSFSNRYTILCAKREAFLSFIHSLHHYQTVLFHLSFAISRWLVYHTFLHHSEAYQVLSSSVQWLVYHSFLHHSQTRLI